MQDMPTPSALAGSGIPSPGTAKTATPGDSAGVAVPSVQAAAGTSEEHTEAQAVRVTSVAPPGQPDGQVDTRP
jgi:hypothetical protein